MKVMFNKILQKLFLTCVFFTVLAGFGIIAYYIEKFSSNESYLSSVLTNKENKIEKALFSPDDDIKNILLSLIECEKEGILIAIFSLTHKEISESIIQAHQRGIKVECIADKGYCTDKFSKIGALAQVEIPVWVYGKKDFFFNDSLMHNKFIIFKRNINDKPLIWTGSFNFTNRACKSNQENVMILESTEIIESYKKQFELIKTRCALISGVKEDKHIIKKDKVDNYNFLNLLINWKKYIFGF